MKKFSLKLIPVAAILLFTHFNIMAQGTGYIHIKGKQFYDEYGNAFFPLQVNMGIDLTYNAWEQLPVVLTDSVISPDAFYFSANYSLGPTNEHECDTQALCTEQLWHYLYKIKDMGFNCFRIHTIGVKYKPKNYAGAVFEDKFYLIINPNEVRDSLGHLIWYDPLDPAFRYLEISKPYSTNPFLAKILDSYETILTMADSLGIKVSFDIAPEGVTLSENAISDYCEYLAVVGDRLKNHPNILAHVIVEEPAYTDEDIFHTKQQVCEIMSSFYDTLKTHDPNHLITIGGHDIFDVREWDPTVMRMDFYQPHIYPDDDSPLYDMSIESQIKRTAGRLYWLDKNCPMPWMIGEGGVGWVSGYSQPDVGCNDSLEQKMYADSSLQRLCDCAGSGYSWWYFQEIYDKGDTTKMGYMNEIGFGLLGHGDVGTNTIIEKPAVETFRNFLDTDFLMPTYTPNYTLCTKPDNYYDPFSHTTFNPTKHNTVSGTLVDQNNQPIEDAFIFALNWEGFFNGKNNHTWIYTFTDENGDFEVVPYTPYLLDTLDKPKIIYIRGSASGAERFERGQGYPWSDIQMQTNVGTIELDKMNFRYNGVVSGETVEVSETKNFKGWNTLNISNTTIEGTSDIMAREEVHLTGEFHATSTSEVHIFNAVFFSDCSDSLYTRMTNNVTAQREFAGISEKKVSAGEIEIDFKPAESLFVSVFPNPNKGTFTVQFNGNKGDANIEIKNLLGGDIASYKFTGNETLINAEELPKGIYFIEVSNSDKTFTKKIIIN